MPIRQPHYTNRKNPQQSRDVSWHVVLPKRARCSGVTIQATYMTMFLHERNPCPCPCGTPLRRDRRHAHRTEARTSMTVLRPRSWGCPRRADGQLRLTRPLATPIPASLRARGDGVCDDVPSRSALGHASALTFEWSTLEVRSRPRMKRTLRQPATHCACTASAAAATARLPAGASTPGSPVTASRSTVGPGSACARPVPRTCRAGSRETGRCRCRSTPSRSRCRPRAANAPLVAAGLA